MSRVLYERVGDVGIITFDHPPINAFSADFEEGFLAAIRSAMRGDVRALLTKASGPNFCAGADVNMFVGLDRRTGSGLVSGAINMVNLVESLPIPTVCAVNGMAIAAGMEIMLAHDIAIVGQSAQIGQTEAMIGTATLAGGAQRIAARAGVARAKEMVFEAKVYSAETLERWNIVNKVVADDKLHEHALAYARRLAAGPTAAYAIGKAAINAFAAPGLSSADGSLIGSAGQVFETSDKQRGVKAFLKDGAKAFSSGDFKYEGK
ncbi:enoyl-CoA hydratase/isomerase family protein [Roseovarius sp. 2305UL8-3]|uniref:enoyl-CoA hydratase/isomerase family protein n=1 Tax=Roseovarius conchicola TaxID=3121636 RepID=UPI0035275C34